MPLLQELTLSDLFELFILFGESLIVPASKDSCWTVQRAFHLSTGAKLNRLHTRIWYPQIYWAIIK